MRNPPGVSRIPAQPGAAEHSPALFGSGEALRAEAAEFL